MMSSPRGGLIDLPTVRERSAAAPLLLPRTAPTYSAELRGLENKRVEMESQASRWAVSAAGGKSNRSSVRRSTMAGL